MQNKMLMFWKFLGGSIWSVIFLMSVNTSLPDQKRKEKKEKNILDGRHHLFTRSWWPPKSLYQIFDDHHHLLTRSLITTNVSSPDLWYHQYLLTRSWLPPISFYQIFDYHNHLSTRTLMTTIISSPELWWPQSSLHQIFDDHHHLFTRSTPCPTQAMEAPLNSGKSFKRKPFSLLSFSSMLPYS